MPRLPLEGSIDLTYRCNNTCRHCWLWLAEKAPEQTDELTFDEWREVIDQARALGTQRWAISGGEPMLRPDFADIFEHATSKAVGYSLNTNGTLITPAIARLLRRKGSKMVAVYGATAEVYDHVTRNPGGFEALLQGLAYLKEADAGFIVQLIPMRDNWHQWDEMLAFARSWSRHWRVGAPWLHKSACGDPQRNAEIERQRLYPVDVVALDEPDVWDEELDSSLNPEDDEGLGGSFCVGDVFEGQSDDRVFARCIAERRGFHVDPYGHMSWCGFVKDRELRYDLRVDAPVAALVGAPDRAPEGPGIAPDAVTAAWHEFIPVLADRIHGGREYLEGCAVCGRQADCNWCGVYGYLEHGRHGAKVEYLCEVARESRSSRASQKRKRRRYYAIGGMTVCVDSDLPIDANTFSEKFALFETAGPGADNLTIRHHFELPNIDSRDLGELVYRKAPWAIYRKGRSWVYLGISSGDDDLSVDQVAVFSDDHTRLRVYHGESGAERWMDGGIHSLTMLPTDLIMLSRVLADREGCCLHSGGMVLSGRGLLFVGHSGAGKSTTMKLLRGHGEVLCDDRNIVRREPGGGFRVYGTWSHGEVPVVSAADAPLVGILFLRKSDQNRIDAVADRSAVHRELLGTIIKPLVTAEWWHKSLDVIERIADEVPCYEMLFDTTGPIVPLIEGLSARQ